MNIIELNVKDYIKKQTNNISFESENTIFFISQIKCNKPNYIDFNEIYKLYNEFKKLGKKLYIEQDKIIKKIEFHNDTIFFKWPLVETENITSTSNTYLANFLTTKYEFTNENIGLDKIKQAEIISFAELIYLCSDSIKDFCSALNDSLEKIEQAEIKFRRIISIYQDEVEQSFSNYDLNKIPSIISSIDKLNPNLSTITEELSFNDEIAVIEPWIKYKDILSIFFHFFKLEIVYYSFMIENEKKKPKLCNICGKYTIGKCKCMGVTNSYRRNQNKKCRVERNKLFTYLHTYSEIISDDCRLKTERMLEEKHRWQDLNELRRLRYEIEKQLKETKNN